MHKNKKQFRNTINDIIKYINLSPVLLKSFCSKTKNRKYNIKELLVCILKINKTGISFRDSPYLFNNTNISWSTIYKFNNKLVRYNIISETFKKTVKKFQLNNNNKNKIYLTDTTLIQNKMGIDCIGYNPQYLKHKTSKISCITNIDGVPLDIYTCSGNHYDSKILVDQFNKTDFFDNIDNKNKNILLADAAYDDNKIKEILNNKFFGKLLCHRNKRNTKNKKKLEKQKLNIEEIKLLKKRSKIEHFFAQLKTFRRVSLRYDKLIIKYNHFVLLSSLMIFLKKTTKNKSY